MVPTPAPKSCHRETKSASDSNWILSFQIASTQRTRKRFIALTWMVVVCAVFPMGLWSTSEPTIVAAESQRDESVPKSDKTEKARAADNVSAPTTATSVAPTHSTGSSSAKTTTPVTDTKPTTAPAGITTSTTAPLQSVQMSGQIYRLRAIVSGQTRQKNVSLLAGATSVKDGLAAMGIKLEPLDRVIPDAATPVYEGMTISVTRVRADLKKDYEFKAQEVRYKATASLPNGAVQTIDPGQPLTIETTTRVWKMDGKVTKTEFVNRRVVKQMQPKLIGLGTKHRYVPSQIPYHSRYARAYGLSGRSGSVLSSRSGSPRDRMKVRTAPPQTDILRAVKSIELVATGYSPDPRENGGYTVTCTGLSIGYGAAAVDPRVIPLGTKLYVEGYGYAFACDVGGAIKGHRIDLAYDSYYLANTKGRKKVRVWILQP